MRTLSVYFFSLLLPLALGVSLTGCESAPEPELEVVRLDSAQALQAARRIEDEAAPTPAEGVQVDLWASEQLLADPIALDVDSRGRVYVTGSNRSSGLLDVRSHPDWTTEVLTHRTVEDLRTFIRTEMAPDSSAKNVWLPDLNEDGSHDWRDLTVKKERLFLIEDSTRDGLADRSQVMIEGFNSEITDAAGGLMVDGGNIYLAAAPDLWRLRDESGNGVIDARKSISHGYHVHFGFFGHGMSGVTRGPDGRIYWSMGDLGFSVVDDEGKRWASNNQGAIFRANPDGSEFEVFARGLRNPHEFAFDEYGNLISVDNDGDHPGETERLVYIVEGSDSGWRANWQYGKYTDPKNNEYKVWMDEGLYKPRFEGQAAYITPPVASYHSGPTGLVYNPGTALSGEWQDYFLMSEFNGSPATSKIHAFRLNKKGAGFELAQERVLLSDVLATGIEFGPDGALYVADWMEGWESNGEGRIWKADVPAAASSPIRKETQSLLAESFADQSENDLQSLLRHADMRVRKKAQFELAGRSAEETLLKAARQTDHQLARLHGLWGLSQLARRQPELAASLTPFLEDEDPEVRAQAARLLGDVEHAPAGGALVPMLRDTSRRVRFFAAQALGQIEHGPAVQPLITMLEENDNEDVYLRHAGSLALARIGRARPIIALADDSSRAVRTAAVVALRRMKHPGVARFLKDEDEYVVTEAARAINDDGGIEGALPQLARVLEEDRFSDEQLLRRALSANLRVGTADAAQRVAAFASRRSAPEAMRVEAVDVLGTWPRPSVLNRVDGIYHGRVTRDTALAAQAITPIAEPLLTDGSAAVRKASAKAVGRLNVDAAAPLLMTRLQDDASADVRSAALRALLDMRAEQLGEAVRTALTDRSANVRGTALDLVPSLDLPDGTTAKLLASVLEDGTIEEKQRALEHFGQLDSPLVNETLADMLTRLESRSLAPQIQLDLIEAIEASDAQALHDQLAAYRDAKPEGDSLATYRETLYGGDPQQGRRLFFAHAAAQCTRCHSLGIEGATVGPNLSEIGASLTREQILQALVDPNARIAPGYGSVSVTLQDGQTISGPLVGETQTHLEVTVGGENRRIAKEQIAERSNAVSSMPPMGPLLDKRQIRDVVAFLNTLK